MAVIGDPKARLNALASGGTAGLSAFDAAQKATSGYRQSALEQALGGRGYASAGMTSGAKAEVEGVVKNRTQGYVDDAASARNLAGAQVGYDSQALDAFLAKQQQKLNAKESEANRNMELDKLQHEGTMISRQASLKSAQDQKADAEAKAAAVQNDPFAWFNSLSKEDQDAWVKGAAEAGRQAAAQRGQQAQEAAARIKKNPVPGVGVMTKDAYAKKVEEVENAGSQNQGALGASGLSPFLAAPPAKAPGLMGYVQNPMDELARQQLAYLESQLPEGVYNVDRNLPWFQQQAAINLAGMDPYLAMGRYPNDEIAQAEIDKDLRDARMAPDEAYLSDMSTQRKIDEEEFYQATGMRSSAYSSEMGAANWNLKDTQDFLKSDTYAAVKDAVDAVVAEGGPRELMEGNFNALIRDLWENPEDIDPDVVAFATELFKKQIMGGPNYMNYVDQAQTDLYG